jgi:hypothetical protein
MTGQGAPAGGPSAGFGGQQPQRSYEERQQAREQMMNNIRETSQQDRRVYVGNLSYDVKWHHLKDFMRQGAYRGEISGRTLADELVSWRSSLCRCAIASEWNVEGGLQRVIHGWFLLWFPFPLIFDGICWIDGWDFVHRDM